MEYMSEERLVDGLRFRVEWHYDEDTGAPWWEHDGHGIVTDWERRNKRPGEMVLCSDRFIHRFYDYQASVRLALQDGWNTAPYQFRTKREQAAAAAMADFKRLRAWCNDEWHWCGVVVKMLDSDIEHSLWGIESDAGDDFEDVIRELVAECMDERERSLYPVTEVGV